MVLAVVAEEFAPSGMARERQLLKSEVTVRLRPSSRASANHDIQWKSCPYFRVMVGTPGALKTLLYVCILCHAPYSIWNY